MTKRLPFRSFERYEPTVRCLQSCVRKAISWLPKALTLTIPILLCWSFGIMRRALPSIIPSALLTVSCAWEVFESTSTWKSSSGPYECNHFFRSSNSSPSAPALGSGTGKLSASFMKSHGCLTLMGSPVTLYDVTFRLLRPSPPFGSSHDNQGPPRFSNRTTRPRTLLNILNLLIGPFHSNCHVILNSYVMLVIRCFLRRLASIFDNVNLIAVASVQACKLSVSPILSWYLTSRSSIVPGMVRSPIFQKEKKLVFKTHALAYITPTL